jgi:hypothetical protein
MSDTLDDNSIMVTMRHVRGADLCSRGSREWFRKYDLSWDEFLTTGISATRILATGDAFAVRVVEVARQEARDGRQQ